jgi:MFS family permease
MINSEKLSSKTWGMVFACSLAGLIPEVSGSVLNQGLDAVIGEFQVPITTGQLMLSTSKLLVAALGDIYGRRTFLVVGVIGM